MLSCPKGGSLTSMGTSKGEGTVSFLCCLALAFGGRQERHRLVLIEMWPSVRQKTCQGHLVTFLYRKEPPLVKYLGATDLEWSHTNI